MSKTSFNVGDRHWLAVRDGYQFPVLKLPGKDWGVIEYTESGLGYKLHIGYRTRREAMAKVDRIMADQSASLPAVNPYDMPIMSSTEEES